MPKYKLDSNVSGKIVKDALASGIPRDAIVVHILGDIEVDDKYSKKFEGIVEEYNNDDADVDNVEDSSNSKSGSSEKVQQ